MDGVLVGIGYIEPGLQRYSIINNGHFIQFETYFGLVVKSDGDDEISIQIPQNYSSCLDGICGNFDGDAVNDLSTKAGDDVSGKFEHKRDFLIGSSWRVDDSEFPQSVYKIIGQLMDIFLEEKNINKI